MHSCIYRGEVRHGRREPVRHDFRYRLFWVYLDLDELPQLCDRRIVRRWRYAPASFQRSDHFGSPSESLGDAVRRCIQTETGIRITGPIRLLTQLRYFGHYFSPLNLYYCFDGDGAEPSVIVGEVSNTPWNERHIYVLWDGNRVGHDGAELRFAHSKGFHVSPFMPMTTAYRWRLSEPGERLGARIDVDKNDCPIFYAELDLQRRELTRGALARCLWRFPVANLKIIRAIYFQAFRLWLKKCPYYPHPKTKLKSKPVR